MEALADCGFIDAEIEDVSSEMEVTAGLIQKLIDKNATRKLDQHNYRKKYDGYASRYTALESRLDSLGRPCKGASAITKSVDFRPLICRE